MATTTSAPTAATCVITYAFDFGWVEVRNVDSGKKMTLDMTGRDPLAFRGAQADMWSMFGNLDNGITLPLTGRQLNTFVRMCRGQQEPNAEVVVKATDTKTAANVVSRQAHNTHIGGSGDLNGLDTRLNSLTKLTKDLDDEFITFFYYIPTDISSECPNPSLLLWRMGMVRLDDSVWTCKRKTLENRRLIALMAHWDKFRCRGLYYYHLDVGPRSMATIRKQAQLRIEEEIRNLHTSLITKIANADEQLQQAIKAEDATQNTTEAADAYRDNRVRSAIKLAAEQLDAAISCAEAFDATEDVASLLDGLRNAIRSQVTTFNAKAGKTGRKLAKV